MLCLMLVVGITEYFSLYQCKIYRISIGSVVICQFLTYHVSDYMHLKGIPQNLFLRYSHNLAALYNKQEALLLQRHCETCLSV